MKHHNNLTDKQIHNAKGFAPARNRSVSTKSIDGTPEWVKGNYTSSVIITPRADVGGDLHHMYFCLYNSYDAVKYAVYFNVSGGDALALPSGYVGVIAVDVTASGSGSTIPQVGVALQAALNAHASFVATVDADGLVTLSGMITSTPPFDSSSGFTFKLTQAEIYNEVLTTDGTGKIKFVSKSSFSSEIEDVEGTEIKSTGETGGTKFLREDGDGTSSWQTVAGGGSAITIKEEGTALATAASSLNFTGNGVIASGTGVDKTITITDTVGLNNIRFSDNDSSSDSQNGDASFQFLGGTGIDVVVASNGTVTVSETIEKKSKDDVEALLGVTGTNLGDFTGGTVTDDSTIKAVIQEIITRVEAIVGVASADLGTFTGTVVSANQDIKAAMQQLETYVENVLAKITAIIGHANDDYGTFTGTVLTDNRNTKQAFQELETYVEATLAKITAIVGHANDNHGTFTGSTITDNQDTKAVLQLLETKAETKATSSVRGIAKFNTSDFTVTDGDVALSKAYHYTNVRYSASNLNGTTHTSGEGEDAGWVFAEMNNNNHNRFFTAIDVNAMDKQLALRSIVFSSVDSVAHRLIGGTVLSSGESGNAHTIKVYKADGDATSTNMAMTLMGTFSIDGSANTAPEQTNITLSSTSADTILGNGDAVIIVMHGIETYSDMDARGNVTLRFEDTF
tara:strand:+ start:258 stop:2303 length:2046 start_codon:yes stop_codon:yes gene_type:complete